jgi:hypothetical protein
MTFLKYSGKNKADSNDGYKSKWNNEREYLVAGTYIARAWLKGMINLEH